MPGILGELGTARFNEVLRRTLGVDSNPAPAISPELQAAIVLEMERPEWAYLQNAKRCMGGGLGVASGAAITSHRLRNPATSGVLAVVEEVAATGAAAATVLLLRLSTGAADKANLLQRLPMDSRYGNYAGTDGGACTLSPSYDNASGAFTSAGYIIPIQRTEPPVKLGWVLAPGSALDLESTAINQDVYCRWIWRERRIEDWEK